MEIVLKGSESGQEFSFQFPRWKGINSEILDLIYRPIFSPEKINRALPGFWRYFEALPINKMENVLSLGEGITPLVRIKFKSGFQCFVKQEQLFSSGSYKDRGAAILMSKLKEWGIQEVVQDSSGNAGASVAAYAAAASIVCNIYLPATTSPGKITQMRAYGANIIPVEGSRKQTAEVARKAAESSFYASHCYHPLFFQGTKTFIYEAWEQFQTKLPDYIVLPAGNGTLVLGVYIGLQELANNGLISKMPAIIAVQSEHCMPLKLLSESQQFDMNLYEPGETLAEGIAIPNPIRLNQMLEAIKNTGGEIVTVKESEIKQTWKWLASIGHYIEPTSAATLAGTEKWMSGTQNAASVLTLFSGTGLKASDSIEKMFKNA